MQVLKPTPAYQKYFRNLEVRIGDVNKGNLGMEWFGDDNTLVSCRGPEYTLDLEVFNFQPVSGRYLTIQTYDYAWLGIDEIYVLT